MIRLNKKHSSVAPGILLNQGSKETEKLKMAYGNGVRDFSFDNDVYGHKDVKTELIKLQDKKCCYCERKIHPGFYGDVEHFRPKAGWVQDNEKINQPGYYWLAYDWDNLFFSCEHCNQKYKKNYFPLLNESERAINHLSDIDKEVPVFIHPANENPEYFIEFDFEVARAVDNNIRGQITIERLGLDNDDLNYDRLEKLKVVTDIYYLAKDFPDHPQHLKKIAKEKIVKYYDDAQKDETEYASMLRCFFRKNPVDF